MAAVIVVLTDEQAESLACLAKREMRTRKAQARIVFAAGLKAMCAEESTVGAEVYRE